MVSAIPSACSETQLRVRYEPTPVGFHFGCFYHKRTSLAQTAMQQKPTAIPFYPTYRESVEKRALIDKNNEV